MVNFIELFGNRSLAKLIEFFLSNEEEYLQKDIGKKTKLSKATLIKCLNKLEKDKLVKAKRIGNYRLFTTDNNNQIIKQLKILKTLSELDSLKDIKSNAKIYLYGSAARGENDSKSDIDLLIIGKLKKEDIIKYIKNISNKIKKEIRFEIFTIQDWAKIARKDPAFYERVEKDKIEVV